MGFDHGCWDVLFWPSIIIKKVQVLAPTLTLVRGRTLVTHSRLRFLIYKSWT